MLEFRAGHAPHDLRARGRLTKLGKKDVPLIMDAKNAEFAGHKDIWQDSKDNEETNKAKSAIVLKSAPSGQRLILAGADHDHDFCAQLREGPRAGLPQMQGLMAVGWLPGLVPTFLGLWVPQEHHGEDGVPGTRGAMLIPAAPRSPFLPPLHLLPLILPSHSLCHHPSAPRGAITSPGLSIYA